MPADIRSFFGGGPPPPKVSQGSEGSLKKDEVREYYRCNCYAACNLLRGLADTPSTLDPGYDLEELQLTFDTEACTEESSTQERPRDSSCSGRV